MTERRAISTVAAITLVAVSCVLGLGLAARSARAHTQPQPQLAVYTVAERGAPAWTLSALGLEPGAVALIGLSGVVSCWPGGRRRIGPKPEASLESATEVADRDQLLAPAA